MGGEGGTGGPARPAWVHPSAVADDHPLDGLGDVARALGGTDTSWTMYLLELLAKSDTQRLATLALAVPWHVHAYRWWRAATPTPTAGELLAEMTRVEAVVELDSTAPEPIRKIITGLWEYARAYGYRCVPQVDQLDGDQWVVASLTCRHGTYEGTSDGYAQYVQAVSRAADAWRAAHPPREQARADGSGDV